MAPLALLVTALLAGVLAFVAALLLRTRESALGYVGAGILGAGLGGWLFSLFGIADPLVVSVAGATFAVLATILGAFLVLLIVRLLRRVR
jgi:uncharacterized membrane protein YeaQ/YmgE (transglycosylase-associated protein family)